MDFSKLQAQALESGQDEEAVTVNTRALIDKVLARYSGEWTTLRELIQNAADASATSVKIKFETLPSSTVPSPPQGASKSDILKHILLNHTLKTLLVTNDGDVFNVNDWNRLKRIAEGNPDETKIGAFGVGFYSVFADCEEPFVQSGLEAMAFYWKTNSLFTRRIKVPQDDLGNGSKTNFVLNYRNTTSTVPNLLSICQFLATSMTFVSLQQIELWLDDFKVFSIQKKTSPSVDVPLSRDVDTKTKEGLMKVQGLARESVQMDATFMSIVGFKPQVASAMSKNYGDNSYGSEAPSLRAFFSRLTNNPAPSSRSKALKEEQALQDIVLVDLTALTTANVFLRVTTATIRTSIAAGFAAELERATKKPPPKTTKMAILTSTFDDNAASNTSITSSSGRIAKSVDIFATVLPHGGSQKGRVFIGFPTSQTTGAGFHISAPSVIPTVERESIDLNARWVRTWNVELLRVAGIIARLSFAAEMEILSESITRATKLGNGNGKVTKELIANYVPEALHILETFTYGESTPSSQVATIVEEAFWTTYKRPSIDVFSTRGVLSSNTVRISTDDFSGFVEGIPVVPEPLVATTFITKLRDYGLLTEITVTDVKKELGAKALSRDQLVAFVNWLGKEAIKGAIDTRTVQDLLEATVATIGEDGTQGGIIALSTIKYYRNANKIPPEMPASSITIPFELTRLSSARELEALGWEPLEIVPWLRFLVESRQGRNGLTSEFDITWSPKFAEQVLAIISKNWAALNPGSRNTIVHLLQPLTVVPTKLGMKIPADAYFRNVKLFDDLPIIVGCNGVKENLLAALGVRKTVELEKIFDRLLNPSTATIVGEVASAKWSHVELITYLASVRDDIPTDDILKLRNTPICAAEAGVSGQESARGTEQRYKISELFEPKDALRQLGLPIIQWPGKIGLRMGSQEGRFLTFLGLRSAPSVPELVEQMASNDVPTRSKAMNYFIANHHINSYASFNLGNTDRKILPIVGDEKRLVSPSECFTNEKASLLGFHVLQRQLVSHMNKFGVAENPPMSECMARLIASPPQTKRDAISLFGYLATRTGEIGRNHAERFADALIVPILDRSVSSEKKIEHIAPNTTFIGKSEAYESIFDFVDFSPEANTFLLHVGAKHEPSRLQVAYQVSAEPARILGIVQTPEKYLQILRTLADALPELKKYKTVFNQMKQSPFLLATRQISSKRPNADKDPKKGGDEEDDDEAGVAQFVLQTANKIVVVDDYRSYMLFRDELLAAPFEEALEDFYIALGSSNVASLVENDTRIGSPLNEQGQVEKMRKHLIDRSKLFLHEYRPDQIKHNIKWLEKNLSIMMTSSITSRLSLRGYTLSHTSKLTASLKNDRSKNWILYFTPQYDIWHIAQALVPQLVMRPNTQAVTQLEFFLKESLRSLKSRGFNVDRILRSQAAEARIAESERQKQLVTEQQLIQDQEEQWQRNNAPQVDVPARETKADRRKSNKVAMPGAFDESPESSPTQLQPPKAKKNTGFFSNIRKNLGFDDEMPEQLSNFLGGGNDQKAPAQPPPYDETNAGVTKPRTIGRSGKQTEKASSPAALHQNLVNAIKASRPHDSTTLFSAPQTNQIKETTSYCDSKPSHNIELAGTASNGLRIFTAKDMSISADDFLVGNLPAIQAFSQLLVEVADIYSLQRGSMHMFYDETGGTIAFNSGGAVFANLRFFLQLHSGKMGDIKGRVEATSYWWVVVSHELAHNLVSDHSAEHSFYTESFLQQYFGRMMAKAIGYGHALPEPLQITEPPRQPGAGKGQESSLLD